MTAGAAAGGGWLRRAGRLDGGGGEIVLWSVAEGRRGRRWRSLRLDGAGAAVADLLIEVDTAGRWMRLELTTAAGLLTLHPEPDGDFARGNVVTGRGVVPLALPWSARHRLVLPNEPVAAAALGWQDGEPVGGPAIVVDDRLDPVVVASSTPPQRPADGLPGPSWPLEVPADPPPDRVGRA